MSAVYSRLYVHLVWGTWERRAVFDEHRARRVHGLLHRITINNRCVPYAIGGVEDHVHLLVSLHPAISVSDLVRILKTNTSQFVARTLRVPNFAWQTGYGVFSLRETDRLRVSSYIANQRDHHSRNRLVNEWERTEEAFERGS